MSNNIIGIQPCTLHACPCGGEGRTEHLATGKIVHYCVKDPSRRHWKCKMCTTCQDPTSWKSAIGGVHPPAVKDRSEPRTFRNLAVRLRLISNLSLDGGRWVSLKESSSRLDFGEHVVMLHLSDTEMYQFERGRHQVSASVADNVLTVALYYSDSSSYLSFDGKFVDHVAIKFTSIREANVAKEALLTKLQPISRVPQAPVLLEPGWHHTYPDGDIVALLMDPSMDALVDCLTIQLRNPGALTDETRRYLESQDFKNLQAQLIRIQEKLALLI